MLYINSTLRRFLSLQKRYLGNTLLICYSMYELQTALHCIGADPGFFLGGGAPFFFAEYQLY